MAFDALNWRGRRFLKFLNARKSCPLSFEDRLVYSLLVFRSRFGKTFKCRQIARLLGINKNTACTSYKRLRDHGLLDRETNIASPPKAEHGFVAVENDKTKWQDRLSYLKMPVFADGLPEGLSWRTLTVYFLLVSNAKQDGRMRGGFTKNRISKILPIAPATVAASLRVLIYGDLIKISNRYVVRVYAFDTEAQRLVQPLPKKSKSNKRQLISAERWEDYAVENDISGLKYHLGHMFHVSGYTQAQIDYFSHIHFQYLCNDAMGRIYQEVYRHHCQEQRAGNYLNMTSFKLMCLRLHRQFPMIPKFEAYQEMRQTS